jgi:hypothetical protein
VVLHRLPDERRHPDLLRGRDHQVTDAYLAHLARSYKLHADVADLIPAN